MFTNTRHHACSSDMKDAYLMVKNNCSFDIQKVELAVNGHMHVTTWRHVIETRQACSAYGKK